MVYLDCRGTQASQENPELQEHQDQRAFLVTCLEQQQVPEGMSASPACQGWKVHQEIKEYQELEVTASSNKEIFKSVTQMQPNYRDVRVVRDQVRMRQRYWWPHISIPSAGWSPIVSTSVSAVANMPGSSEHFLEIHCLYLALLHTALHEINYSRIPENQLLLIFVAFRCTANFFHCS